MEVIMVYNFVFLYFTCSFDFCMSSISIIGYMEMIKSGKIYFYI